MIKYLLLILLFNLIGCNSSQPTLSPIGSIEAPSAPDTSVSISGFLTGLTSGTLTLSNGDDTILMSGNGVFTFASKIPLNSSYNVLIQSMPAGLNCIVAGGLGTATQNVNTVQVKCGSSSRYLVSGAIAGLTTSGLELKLNVGAVEIDALTVAENASSLLFNGTLANGANYLVTISSQPAGKNCVLTNGVGTVNLANVTNIFISCIDSGSVTLSGNISGLSVGESISIGANAESGTNPQTISFGTTSFSFPIGFGHRGVIEILSSSNTNKYCYFTSTKVQKFYSSQLVGNSTGADIHCAVRNPLLCERGTSAHDVPDAVVSKAICDNGYLYFIGGFYNVGKHLGAGSVLDISTASPTPPPTQDKIIGTVNKILPDGSGGWYVGGEFTKVGNQSVSHLVHFFSDLTLDPNFNVKPNNIVYDLHLDGTSLWVAGAFSSVVMNGGAVQNRKGIFKLDLSSGNPILDDFYINLPATSWGDTTGQARVFAIITDAASVFITGLNLINTTSSYDISSFAKTGLDPARNDIDAGHSSITESLHLAADSSGTEFLWLSTNVAGSYGLYKINKTTLGAIPLTVSGMTSSERVSRSILLGNKIYAISTSGLKVMNLATGTSSFTAIGTILGQTLSGSLLGIASDGNETICLSGSSMVIGGGTTRRGLACFDNLGLKSFDPAVNPSSALAMSGSKLFFSSTSQLWNQTSINALARVDMNTGIADSLFNFGFNNTTPSDFTIQGTYLYLTGSFSSTNGNVNLKNHVRIDTSTRIPDAGFYNTHIRDNLTGINRIFVNASALFYQSGTQVGSILLGAPLTAPTIGTVSSSFSGNLFTPQFIRAGGAYFDLGLTPSLITCPGTSNSQISPLSDGSYLLSDAGNDPRKVDSSCGSAVNILPNVDYAKATPDVICGIDSGMYTCSNSLTLDPATDYPGLGSVAVYSSFDVSKNAFIYHYAYAPSAGLNDYSPYLQAFTIRP